VTSGQTALEKESEMGSRSKGIYGAQQDVVTAPGRKIGHQRARHGGSSVHPSARGNRAAMARKVLDEVLDGQHLVSAASKNQRKNRRQKSPKFKAAPAVESGRQRVKRRKAEQRVKRRKAEQRAKRAAGRRERPVHAAGGRGDRVRDRRGRRQRHRSWSWSWSW
jgi:hypothetical protein